MDQGDLKLRIYQLRISLRKRSDKRIELAPDLDPDLVLDLDPVQEAEVEADLTPLKREIKLNKTKKIEIETKFKFKRIHQIDLVEV